MKLGMHQLLPVYALTNDEIGQAPASSRQRVDK